MGDDVNSLFSLVVLRIRGVPPPPGILAQSILNQWFAGWFCCKVFIIG